MIKHFSGKIKTNATISITPYKQIFLVVYKYKQVDQNIRQYDKNFEIINERVEVSAFDIGFCLCRYDNCKSMTIIDESIIEKNELFKEENFNGYCDPRIFFISKINNSKYLYALLYQSDEGKIADVYLYITIKFKNGIIKRIDVIKKINLNLFPEFNYGTKNMIFNDKYIIDLFNGNFIKIDISVLGDLNKNISPFTHRKSEIIKHNIDRLDDHTNHYTFEYDFKINNKIIDNANKLIFSSLAGSTPIITYKDNNENNHNVCLVHSKMTFHINCNYKIGGTDIFYRFKKNNNGWIFKTLVIPNNDIIDKVVDELSDKRNKIMDYLKNKVEKNYLDNIISVNAANKYLSEQEYFFSDEKIILPYLILNLYVAKIYNDNISVNKYIMFIFWFCVFKNISKDTVYTHQFVEINDNFNKITKMSPHYIFSDNNISGITFSCGMVKDNDNFIISYGLNDTDMVFSKTKITDVKMFDLKCSEDSVIKNFDVVDIDKNVVSSINTADNIESSFNSGISDNDKKVINNYESDDCSKINDCVYFIDNHIYTIFELLQKNKNSDIDIELVKIVLSILNNPSTFNINKYMEDMQIYLINNIPDEKINLIEILNKGNKYYTHDLYNILKIMFDSNSQRLHEKKGIKIINPYENLIMSSKILNSSSNLFKLPKNIKPPITKIIDPESKKLSDDFIINAIKPDRFTIGPSLHEYGPESDPEEEQKIITPENEKNEKKYKLYKK